MPENTTCTAQVAIEGDPTTYTCNRKGSHKTHHATFSKDGTQLLAVWCTCADCSSPAPDMEDFE